MKKRDPLEAFLYILCKYLRDRSSMVFSLAEAAGQKRLTISLYGLWRRHRFWETGYKRFIDIVNAVLEDEELVARLRYVGVEEVVLEGSEPYIVVNIDKIRQRLSC